MKSLAFYAGQIPQFLAMLLGFVILPLPCYLAKWNSYTVSNKVWPPPYEMYNGRTIDRWEWDWLNKWFGNPEDGVSGRFALIWDGNKLVVYNPEGSRWKAFCWVAWRNSVDSLKYDFPQS